LNHKFNQKGIRTRFNLALIDSKGYGGQRGHRWCGSVCTSGQKHKPLRRPWALRWQVPL